MREGQEAIYYITAESHNAAAGSPQLEIFRKNGIEVLLMSDRIDEWMMGYFQEFDGKRMQSVAKGDVNLSGIAGAEQADDSDLEGEHQAALDRVKEVIGDRISGVSLSRRLTDSASCLVLSEDQMALHMQRLLEQAGQDVPASVPALELNPDHPLVARILEAGPEESIEEMSQLAYEQAILAEGGQLEDPAGFVRRVNALLFGHTADEQESAKES